MYDICIRTYGHCLPKAPELQIFAIQTVFTSTLKPDK